MKKSQLFDVFVAFLGVALFRLALDSAYILMIAPSYGSVGFQYYPDLANYVVSWVAASIGVPFFLPLRKGSAVKLAQFLFLVTFIPSTSYFAMTGYGGSVLLYGLLFWLIVMAIAWSFVPPSIPAVTKGSGPLVLTCGFIGASAVGLSFMVFGFQLNFALFDVYDFRAGRSLDGIPFGGYLIPWAAKVAIPFLILYCWYELRRAGRIIFAFAVVIQILLFATSGHKTYLFIAPAAMFLGWAAAKDRFAIHLPYFLAIVIVFCLIADYVSGGYSWSGVVTRRVFFVPAQLTYFHFEFFHENYLYLSHSVLSFLISYPYSIPPPNMIGLTYFGLADQSSNAGVLADGFMNFGLLGVIGWAIILGVILLLSEAATRGRNQRICLPVIILSIYTLANGALFTALLTHGLLLAIALSALMVPSNAAALAMGQRIEK